MVALSSLPMLLLLYQTRHAQADTANADALARRAARKEWRQAWPGGCREYEDRKEAKGRFCSLTASVAGRDGRDITDLDDVTMTIGSVSRLRELAAAFGKRQARTAETLVPTAQDHAARAALAAVELAAAKHAKRDADRRQQAQRQRREVPARRVPSEYRCHKAAKEPKTAEAVEFTCSVSDHTLEAAAPAGEDRGTGPSAEAEGGGAAATPARDSPEERCARYKLWKAEYASALVPGEGTVGEGFYDYLGLQYEPLGTLAKLRRQTLTLSLSLSLSLSLPLPLPLPLTSCAGTCTRWVARRARRARPSSGRRSNRTRRSPRTATPTSCRAPSARRAPRRWTP